MAGLIWIAFCLVCYWLAKAKGLSVKKWVILGFFFGPFALAVLAFQKKSDSPPVQAMIKEQAVESIRSVKYAVDNISSRLGGSRNKKK